ncbi:expressed protein, partial [Aureococcus anophagefferens]
MRCSARALAARRRDDARLGRRPGQRRAEPRRGRRHDPERRGLLGHRPDGPDVPDGAGHLRRLRRRRALHVPEPARGVLGPPLPRREVAAEPGDGPRARAVAELPRDEAGLRPDDPRRRRLLLRVQGPAVGDAPEQRAALRGDDERGRRRARRADDERPEGLRRPRLVHLVQGRAPPAGPERGRLRGPRAHAQGRAREHRLRAPVRRARPHAPRAHGVQRRQQRLPLPVRRRRHVLRRRPLPRVLRRGPDAPLGRRCPLLARPARDVALQVLQRVRVVPRRGRRPRGPGLLRRQGRARLGRHQGPPLPRRRLRQVRQVPRAVRLRRRREAVPLQAEHLRAPHAHPRLRRLRRARSAASSFFGARAGAQGGRGAREGRRGREARARPRVDLQGLGPRRLSKIKP